MNFKVKQIMKHVTVLLTAALICLTAIAISWSNVFGKTELTDKPFNHDENVIVTPENSKLMKLSVMSDYGDTESPEFAQKQITATVMPAIAENKTISWKVVWKNSSGRGDHSGSTDSEPESLWGQGKNVEDYISLSAKTSQSGESITMICKQDFGETIIVTATSAADTKIFATCNVDYCQKIKSVNYTFKYGDTVMSTPSTDTNGVYLVDYTGEAKTYTVECLPEYTAHTVEEQFIESISGTFTDEFGYTSEYPLTELSLQAGLHGGNYEPELSSDGEQFIKTVTDATKSSNNALLSMMDFAKEKYESLSEAEKSHSKIVNANEAYELMKNAIVASGNGSLSDEVRAEAISLLNSYIPPTVTGNFTGSVTILTENDLLMAAKTCNDAGKGIAEFTVKYTGAYSEKVFIFKLGYSLSSITTVKSMNISLPSYLF